MKRDFASPDYQNQGGFMLVESLGSMLFYLIMIAAAGVLLISLFSGSKISQTEQAISSLRLQVKQLYTSSSDYSGLDTDLARQSRCCSGKNEQVQRSTQRLEWTGYGSNRHRPQYIRHHNERHSSGRCNQAGHVPGRFLGVCASQRCGHRPDRRHGWSNRCRRGRCHQYDHVYQQLTSWEELCSSPFNFPT